MSLFSAKGSVEESYLGQQLVFKSQITQYDNKKWNIQRI